MKICIVAGGTLGHIMPGLVLARELSKKYDVIYITSNKDKRFKILNTCEYLKKVYYVEAQGFNKNIFKNLNTVIKTLKGIKEVKKIYKEEKIDVVIGMGGYISGIAILGTDKKIKTIIHEQNKVMGLANKVVLNKVNKILLSFDIDLKTRYKKKSIIVSNPCLFNNNLNIDKENNNILITSGSNGAKEINDIAINIINNNLLSNYHITLVTGKKYYDEVISKVNKKINVDIYPFINNMNEYISKSTLIITRAGSSTLFESIGLNTIPLMIPSSNVTNNHQYYNALEIENLGMGEIVDKDTIIKKVNKVNNNKQYYLQNIRLYKKHYSIQKIINIIEEEIKSKR